MELTNKYFQSSRTDKLIIECLVQKFLSTGKKQIPQNIWRQIWLTIKMRIQKSKFLSSKHLKYYFEVNLLPNLRSLAHRLTQNQIDRLEYGYILDLLNIQVVFIQNGIENFIGESELKDAKILVDYMRFDEFSKTRLNEIKKLSMQKYVINTDDIRLSLSNGISEGGLMVPKVEKRITSKKTAFETLLHPDIVLMSQGSRNIIVQRVARNETADDILRHLEDVSQAQIFEDEEMDVWSFNDEDIPPIFENPLDTDDHIHNVHVALREIRENMMQHFGNNTWEDFVNSAGNSPVPERRGYFTDAFRGLGPINFTEWITSTFENDPTDLTIPGRAQSQRSSRDSDSEDDNSMTERNLFDF